MIVTESDIGLEKQDGTIVSIIGYCSYEQFDYPRHYHPNPELCICLSGSITVTGPQPVCVPAHTVCIIPPMVVHGFHSEGSCRSIVMVINSQLFPNIPDLSYAAGGVPCCFSSFPQLSFEELLALTDRILAYRTDNELLTCYVRILLIHMTRTMMDAQASEKLPDSAQVQILNRVLVTIRERYRTDLTLSELSEAVFCDRFVLSKLINRYFQCSFRELVNSYKIEEACRLLSESNDNIVDIAQYVGFASLNTFNRNFREKLTLSPSEYRKQYRVQNMTR